jgi:hypothetical protein
MNLACCPYKNKQEEGCDPRLRLAITNVTCLLVRYTQVDKQWTYSLLPMWVDSNFTYITYPLSPKLQLGRFYLLSTMPPNQAQGRASSYSLRVSSSTHSLLETPTTGICIKAFNAGAAIACDHQLFLWVGTTLCDTASSLKFAIKWRLREVSGMTSIPLSFG